MSLTSDIKETYRYNMDSKLKKLCDSHDELERKLKIAEDALEKVNEDTVFIIALHAAREALKQIRGE